MLTDTFLKSCYGNPQLNLDLYFKPTYLELSNKNVSFPEGARQCVKWLSDWTRLPGSSLITAVSDVYVNLPSSIYKDQVESPNAYFKQKKKVLHQSWRNKCKEEITTLHSRWSVLSHTFLPHPGGQGGEVINSASQMREEIKQALKGHPVSKWQRVPLCLQILKSFPVFLGFTKGSRLPSAQALRLGLALRTPASHGGWNDLWL